MMRVAPTTYHVAVTLLGEGQKQGHEFKFVCPRHEDKHPSLSVNTSKNCFYCHPCQTGGNYWALAAFTAGLDPDDRQAVAEYMREKKLL